MKPASLLLFLLLLAACASAPADVDNTDGSFVSESAAPDANTNNEVRNTNSELSPLTAEELKAAALKVSSLETAADSTARNKLLDQLVALGPRYLRYFREVDREAIALDMMYVIRRIEREHPTATAEKPVDDGTGKTDRGAGLEGPKIDYGTETEDFNREEVERFLAARLEQARRHLEGGRFDAAKRIAEAAITLLPDTRVRGDFDALIAQANGQSQANLLIAGVITLEPGHLQYAAEERGAIFKTPLQIRCFLKNVSANPITLLLYDGDGRESILQLAVHYEQLDFQGNALSQRDNVRLPIDGGESITLKPNDSYELTVPLTGLTSIDADAPLKRALGRVEIDAALRVYGASDAEGRPIVLRPVRFPIRTINVYPFSFDLDGATARPISALRNAIDKGLAQDLYMVSHFVAKKDRRAAGDLLVDDAYDNSTLAMQRARLLAMSVIFETGKAWDIKRWRTWWQENRLK